MLKRGVTIVAGLLLLPAVFMPLQAQAATAGTITAGNSKANCIALAGGEDDGQGGAFSPSNLEAAESATGVTFNCLTIFLNPVDDWADWETPWVFSNDYVGTGNWATWLGASPSHQMILGMDLVPQSAPGNPDNSDGDNSDPQEWESACAAGDYDSYATQLAEDLVSYGAFANGSPLVVRLGIEANGNWEADYVGGTSTEAADWAACYDNEVTAMKAVAGTDFLFVWNPNACYSSAENAPGLSAWYPGNAYVDIIGADDYDVDCTNNDTVAQEGWAAYASAGDPSLDSIEAFAVARGKSMALPEWGLLSGDDDPAYVDGIGQMVASDNFAYQSYFDINHDGIAALGSDLPESTAAYMQEFSTTPLGTSKPKLRLIRWAIPGLTCCSPGLAGWGSVYFSVSGIGTPIRRKASRWVPVGPASIGTVARVPVNRT
jgi:Glycosyl hydrolase family 26